MMRLTRWQMLFSALTLVALVAASVSTYNNARSPDTYASILTAAENSTPAITVTSQDALNYQTVVKQWLKDLKLKSDVAVARATLASDLTVVNLSTGQYISALLPAKTLEALTSSDAVIAKYPQNVMPLVLGAKIRTLWTLRGPNLRSRQKFVELLNMTDTMVGR